MLDREDKVGGWSSDSLQSRIGRLTDKVPVSQNPRPATRTSLSPSTTQPESRKSSQPQHRVRILGTLSPAGSYFMQMTLYCIALPALYPSLPSPSSKL